MSRYGFAALTLAFTLVGDGCRSGEQVANAAVALKLIDRGQNDFTVDADTGIYCLQSKGAVLYFSKSGNRQKDRFYNFNSKTITIDPEHRKPFAADPAATETARKAGCLIAKRRTDIPASETTEARRAGNFENWQKLACP